MKISDLIIGEIYNRDDLISAFGGSFYRGINICKTTNTLVLISKHMSNRIYGDDFNNGYLMYTGEGQKGDQQLTYGNKKLAESITDNTPIHLFMVYKKKEYTYFGLVKLIKYSNNEKEEDIDGNMRTVFRFKLQRQNDIIYDYDTESQYISDFPSIKKVINVVGAAIIKDGMVLCAKRGYGPLKGMWEFPGGKIENGETQEQALKREIKEELGIDIDVRREIDSSEYEYSDRIVNLSVFECYTSDKIINDTEHQEIKWFMPNELNELNWSEADIPIKDALIDIMPLPLEKDPVKFSYFESKPIEPSSNELRRSVQDYELSARKKRKSGEMAELAVIRHEKDILNNSGRPELADKVDQVSKKSSDYGYDILSFELDDKGIAHEVHIEVKKATLSNNYLEFFISQNELNKFKTDESYKIYCLFRSGKCFKHHIVNRNDFFANDYLIPLTYKVRIKISQ